MSHPCPANPARNVEDARRGRKTSGPCAGVADDTTICRACTADLEQALAELPALVGDLESTLSRQGGRSDGGSRAAEHPVPYDVRASGVLGDLRAVLVGWIRDLDDKPEHHPADNLEAMARWLLARLSGIATHPAAEEIHREIFAAFDRGCRAIDNPPDRQFLGTCPTCSLADIYARVGATGVICRDCGTAHEVTELRESLKARLDDRLVTAAEFARMRAYLGEAVDRDHIRRLVNVWATRGRITSHPGPRYRFGELQQRMGERMERGA